MYAALPGRRSFGGFNKPVEKHYASVMESHVQKGKYGAARNSQDQDKDRQLLELAAMSEPALPGRAQKKKPKGGKAGGGGGGKKR